MRLGKLLNLTGFTKLRFNLIFKVFKIKIPFYAANLV